MIYLKMEIEEIDGNDGHIYRLKKSDEIQEILIAEREIEREREREREREISETNLVQNAIEEFILLV